MHKSRIHAHQNKLGKAKMKKKKMKTKIHTAQHIKPKSEQN